MQRRNQIVVPVLRLVVDRRAPLDHFDQLRRLEYFARARPPPDLLGECQYRAAVAIGHADQGRARLLVERKFFLFLRFRTFQNFF